jgi:hypothetical protein
VDEQTLIRKAMSALGRKKSPAKTAAARENVKKATAGRSWTYSKCRKYAESRNGSHHFVNDVCTGCKIRRADAVLKKKLKIGAA